jgi:hypothetical protein
MPGGQKGLYFGGRLTITSAKNAILVDREDLQCELVGIRKIARHVLEIDAMSDVLPVHAFAAGMAAWLGP